MGKTWTILNGDIGGQTHTDYPDQEELAIWAHPIDVHLSTSSVQVFVFFAFAQAPLISLATCSRAGRNFYSKFGVWTTTDKTIWLVTVLYIYQ